MTRGVTGAVVGVDGHDAHEGFGGGGRGEEGEGVPDAGVEDAEEGEVEPGELEGEELGGEAGAEERAPGPGGGEALRVVGMEVGQEVRLAPFRPPIYRDQTSLHGIDAGSTLRPERGSASTFVSAREVWI